MNASIREEILKSLESFPSLSPAATRVLPLLNSPDTTNVSEIESIIRYDPGLTANVLKLANSAYFGLPNTIASISQAVMVMGWKRMYQLVIASTVNGIMDNRVPGYDLERGELWRHSIAASVSAERIVEECGLAGVEEAFTAALLHDVGKLITGKFLDANISLMDAAVSRGLPFIKAERDILGTDHAQAGSWVLEHWSLPKPLVNAVRWHHEPDRAAGDLVVDVVHVSNALAKMVGAQTPSEKDMDTLSPTALERVNLTREAMKEIASRIEGEVTALVQALAPSS